jgi:glycosyltransferase involved in cell wall biosynthesis
MPNLSDKVTVCVFAYNESARIERCIRGFQGLFDILVVDNFSSDNTKAIASSLGCKCISVANPGFIETPEVMDRVFAEVKTDYVLIALAGEFVPYPLLEKYAEVANAGVYEVVMVFRMSITAGQPIPISGLPGRGSPHGQFRFFKKSAMSYVGNQVHGLGRILSDPDKVLSLVDNEGVYFYQFRDYDVSWTERKHAIYNDILAKQRFESGARFSWLRATYKSAKAFLNCYIRFRSFRFGMLGFIHSYYRFHMEFGIWLRIWELEHSLDRDGVIAENNKYREQLEQSDRELRNKRGVE